MIYITSFKKEILQESWNLKQHQIEHSIGRGLLAYGLQEEYRSEEHTSELQSP